MPPIQHENSKCVPLEHAIDALQRAVHAKDAYTAAHNERVARYAVNLARAIGLTCVQIDEISLGALLHDVGKIGISDQVLLKPATLTSEELLLIQQHSSLGQEICEPLGLTPVSLSVVRHHHERMNGRGYPDGLRGSQIPIEVQVVAVADIVDALLTNRVYRHGYPLEKAWDILHDEASRGLHDSTLVEECIRLMASGELFSDSGDTRVMMLLGNADQTHDNLSSAQ